MDEQLEALLAQTRNRRWPWFVAGGVAAAAVAGAVVWWQLQ